MGVSKEELLGPLESYVKKVREAGSGEQPQPGPEQLEAVRWVARTGRNSLPWDDVRVVVDALCRSRLCGDVSVAEARLDGFRQDVETFLEDLDQLPEAPFTLQRLCEVVLDKGLMEGRPEKLLWVVSKLVLVDTPAPVEPFPANGEIEPCPPNPDSHPNGIAEQVIEWAPAKVESEEATGEEAAEKGLSAAALESAMDEAEAAYVEGEEGKAPEAEKEGGEGDGSSPSTSTPATQAAPASEPEKAAASSAPSTEGLN